jgi:hypothetical protein
MIETRDFIPFSQVTLKIEIINGLYAFRQAGTATYQERENEQTNSTHGVCFSKNVRSSILHDDRGICYSSDIVEEGSYENTIV